MRFAKGSIVLCVAALALLGSPERSRAADDNPWSPGTNWVSVRVGYAKASGQYNGNGGMGYGFGFAHMIEPLRLGKMTLFKHWSLGGYLHYESVDHFFASSEVEIPATVEMVRHLNWKTPLHPYLGLGTGAFYHKAYRTGADTRSVDWGWYLTGGANCPVARHQLIGFDTRVIRVEQSYDPSNPVFGPGSGTLEPDANGIPVFESRSATHWSAKINYSITY